MDAPLKLTQRHFVTVAPLLLDERPVRQRIDRAVGRALVDQSFAAQLLAHPALALEAEVCGRAQYVAVDQIRAHELDDFARQIFEQFWGPAEPDESAGNGSLEATS
jgi:hypothetical protein